MAPDPDLAGGEQAEPPDDEVDDPDVDEVDPTGRYFRVRAVPSIRRPFASSANVDMLFSLVGLPWWFIAF
jgi:hypothetical protein